MSYLWDLSHLKPRTDVVVPGETITDVFWNAAAMRGDKVFLREKELGIWREWTWNQTAAAVREIGDGLLALGFEAGDCASILANTVVDWVLADLGILSAGGVSNGIYPTDAAAQVHYLCEDSRTTVLFVEDEEQLDKALEVRERLPLLRRIVVFDMKGLRDFADPQVIAREMVAKMQHAKAGVEIPVIASPIKMSETPPAYRRAPPVCGQDTDDVLRELLDMSAADVDALRMKGVV